MIVVQSSFLRPLVMRYEFVTSYPRGEFREQRARSLRMLFDVRGRVVLMTT